MCNAALNIHTVVSRYPCCAGFSVVAWINYCNVYVDRDDNAASAVGYRSVILLKVVEGGVMCSGFIKCLP